MDQHDCHGPECIIHSRTDGYKRYKDEDGGPDQGMAAKVTYIGEWAVLTQVITELQSPVAQFLRGLGHPADVFTTTVIHVGEGSIGDRITAPESTYDFIRRYESHTTVTVHDRDPDATEARGEKFHDAIVDGVKSGIFELDTPVTPEEFANVIRNAIKKDRVV